MILRVARMTGLTRVDTGRVEGARFIMPRCSSFCLRWPLKPGVQAGIQTPGAAAGIPALDSRFRGNDRELI